ncbi:hypothetical protein BOC42_00600 [Burkholderia pseudomallei]|nr:hypothetical protein BOC42_00600 [Burkholderia pseudomallei]
MRERTAADRELAEITAKNRAKEFAAAAWDAAWDAAWAAAWDAAWAAAWAAAWDAAWDAAGAKLEPTVKQLQASAHDLFSRMIDAE